MVEGGQEVAYAPFKLIGGLFLSFETEPAAQMTQIASQLPACLYHLPHLVLTPKAWLLRGDEPPGQKSCCSLLQTGPHR